MIYKFTFVLHKVASSTPHHWCELNSQLWM